MVGWFTILILCCVFLFTVFLLYQYPSKSTPAIVYIVVFIGWFTAFGIVTLIPYDVYLSNGGEGDKDLLHTAWVVVYWIAFGLCWVILPITEKFHTSGEFTFCSKLRNALFRQLRSFLILISVLSALVLYLYFVKNFTLGQVPQMLVLLSNIWGLFLVIILLGFGLVFLPKTFWNEGNLEKTLRILYLKSVPLDEANIDSKYRLDQCVIKVLQISQRISEASPLKKFINKVLEKCPESSVEHQRNTRRVDESEILEYNDLVKLHKQLNDLIAENQRTQW